MNDPQRPLLDEIARLAQAGFDFIDLALEAPHAAVESTDWPVAKAAIGDAGLGVVCRAAAYLPIDNPSPMVRQAALDELRRAVDAAKLVGAALCTTRFHGWPSYLSETSGYEYYRQLYTVLVEHGQERGVEIALENSPNNQHQLKYFREIFHRLPQLRLAYDAAHGNINTAKSMTRDYLFALNDRLAHVHLSDNDGTADDHLAFGTPRQGGLDLKRELRDLRSFRYDGTITLQILGDPRWLYLCAETVRELWPQVAA